MQSGKLSGMAFLQSSWWIPRNSSTCSKSLSWVSVLFQCMKSTAASSVNSVRNRSQFSFGMVLRKSVFWWGRYWRGSEHGGSQQKRREASLLTEGFQVALVDAEAIFDFVRLQT